MILKDYEETCNPFYFVLIVINKLLIFLIILINLVNRGTKKGLSYDSPPLS
jgi:hypothetical protein